MPDRAVNGGTADALLARMDDTDDEVILLDDPILDATPFIEEVDVMTDDYDELIILRRPDYLIELGV